MTKEPPTQEAFDKLLAWLASDREQAAEKYEKIHLRLTRTFACHGCVEPDRLADEVIDRVIAKIDWLLEKYVGEPTLFFCGVARNVLKEDLRDRVNTKPLPEAFEPSDESEDQQAHECLDECIKSLTQPKQYLALAYYTGDGQTKILNRSKLAEEFGITLRALRLRVYHIRLQLRTCMETCLTRSLAH